MVLSHHHPDLVSSLTSVFHNAAIEGILKWDFTSGNITARIKVIDEFLATVGALLKRQDMELEKKEIRNLPK